MVRLKYSMKAVSLDTRSSVEVEVASTNDFARQNREPDDPPIKVCVPWRMYSSSRRSTSPARIGKARSRAFQGLNTGRLIDRDGLDASLGPFRGQPIGLADIVTFFVKTLVVLGGQPTTHAMRLEAGFFLKRFSCVWCG